MKKIYALTLAVIMILSAFALILPASAEEISTETGTEAGTEAATEAITETVTEAITETVTEFVFEIETEPETAVPVDEWIYNLMKQASPEEVELIEQIILGGIDNLDKLGLQGFDRIRIWVEYNTATVMVIALIFGLIVFIITNILLKRGVKKSSDKLDSNASELYEAGQAQAEVALKMMQDCLESAKQVAETAQKVQEQVTAELEKHKRANEGLCKTVHFLLECSDLPFHKREEAEAIYREALGDVRNDDEA